MRNRRRERTNDDDDDEGPNFHRIQVRAVEGGRRFAWMLLPRPPRETAGAAAAAPLINNEAAAAPMSADDAPLEGRRVIRALRPFARAAQMREVINLADDSDEDTAPLPANENHFMLGGVFDRVDAAIQAQLRPIRQEQDDDSTASLPDRE